MIWWNYAKTYAKVPKSLYNRWRYRRRLKAMHGPNIIRLRADKKEPDNGQAKPG